MGGEIMSAGGAGDIGRISPSLAKYTGYDGKTLAMFLKNMSATGANLKANLAFDPVLGSIMDKVGQGEQQKLLPHEVQLAWKGIFSIFKNALPDIKQAMVNAGKAAGVVFGPVKLDTSLKVLPDRQGDIVFKHAPYSPYTSGDTNMFRTGPYDHRESADGVRTLPLYRDDRGVPGKLTPPPGEK